MGHTLEQRLRGLGMKGLIPRMAARGQIIELVCEMPYCWSPKGRSHFEKRNDPPYDWSPSLDHYPILRSKDGKRYVENARLGHVLCNQRDYTLRKQISDMLRDDLPLKEIAATLNRKKDRLADGAMPWTAASVRRFFVS